jgi:hypothetical protein
VRAPGREPGTLTGGELVPLARDRHV